MYDINEIAKRVNLETAFIRKCLKELKPFLEKHSQRGESNKILFDDNALILFDRIGQMKAEGLAIPEIKKQLEKGMQTETPKTTKGIQTDVNQLLNKVFDLQEELLKEKDRFSIEQEEKNKRIIELEQATASLKTELRLLTDGKTFDEKKQEWEEERRIKEEIEEENKRLLEKQEEKEKLLDELYLTSIFAFKKRKILYEKIKNL